MIKHILVSVALLLNSVVAIIPAWSQVAVGVMIDGDVLVKWPVEYKGKAVVPDGVHHIADRATGEDLSTGLIFDTPTDLKNTIFEMNGGRQCPCIKYLE